MADRNKRSRGKLRTINERAELWQVSPRTIQRLIKSGALRASRIGRLVRNLRRGRRGLSRQQSRRLSGVMPSHLEA